MTAHFRVVHCFRRHQIVTGLCLASACLVASADAAVNCGDRFKVTTMTSTFDGGTFDIVRLTSSALALDVETFAQWRPIEEESDGAALLLQHQSVRGARVVLCPMSPPDLPNGVDAWKKYQTLVAANLGEGTVVSDQSDTTVTDGVRIIGWDTREARFTTKNPLGEVQAVQHHFVLTHGQTGLRIVLTAPPAVCERALDDLRFWLSRISLPAARDS